MRIFDHFDRIRIINLRERTDRRRAMDRELARVGLAGDHRVAYFDAIRPVEPGPFTSIGARGVFASQKQLLHDAAAAGTSLLILEDDCIFLPGVNRGFPAGWAIFYGGYTASDPENLHNSDLQGAHMMGFSRVGAQLVSAYLESLECEGIHPPIDAAYIWFRRRYPEVATLFAEPPIAGQRPSRSDIAPLAWYDRWPLVRDGVAALRTLRGGAS